MLCYVMLCYVMLCYVMLCYVMLCYVMLQVNQLWVSDDEVEGAWCNTIVTTLYLILYKELQ